MKEIQSCATCDSQLVDLGGDMLLCTPCDTIYITESPLLLDPEDRADLGG